MSFAQRVRQMPSRAWAATAAYRVHFGLFAMVLLAVVVAQLCLRWKSTVGMYVNAASFATLVGMALWREAFRKVAISAAILPVVVMVNLCLPQSSNFDQAVVLYDTLLLLTLVYRFMFALDEPVQSTALTLRGYGLTLPLMVVLGQLLGLLGYGMLRTHYIYTLISYPLVAAAVAVFAIAEEMFFRGLLQQRASKVLHPAMAAVLSAVTYASFTLDRATWLAPLFGLIMGGVLSFIYLKKQNLLLTITVNAMSKLAFIGLLATFAAR